MGLAALIPDVGKKGGPLKPEITIKFVAVSIIFFLSGLSLKLSQLGRSVVRWRINLYVFV